ncbi:MAG: hypothetical protein KU37_02935 [Sulfuricurvum sp. PC08-66]|nr:MAG: hypothetical protein KU37_02935 [Sulfuricurvum sp. PC08-66]
MFTPQYHRFFKKDIERDKKSGKYSSEDFALLKTIITTLVEGNALHEKYKNHPLQGEWEGTYECHIKNDWLLVYEINKESALLTFVRLGMHAQIFKKFK